MRQLAIGLTLLAVALTSCNSKDDNATTETPPTTPPTTASSATTPSSPSIPPTQPKPPPPTIPPAATAGLTVTSAEAFARFYLTASDYMVATGNGDLVRQWADKACVACTGLATKYARVYRDGGSVVGDTTTRVLQLSSVRLIGDDTAAVLIKAREGRQTETVRAGAKPTTYPGDTFSWNFTLAASGGHWTMYSMELK